MIILRSGFAGAARVVFLTAVKVELRRGLSSSSSINASLLPREISPSRVALLAYHHPQDVGVEAFQLLALNPFHASVHLQLRALHLQLHDLFKLLFHLSTTNGIFLISFALLQLRELLPLPKFWHAFLFRYQIILLKRFRLMWDVVEAAGFADVGFGAATGESEIVGCGD